MKRRNQWALVFLFFGMCFLAGYLYLIFKTNYGVAIWITLILSILLNVIAVNLFLISMTKKRRRDEDD